MSWFKYLNTSTSTVDQSPPVRRKLSKAKFAEDVSAGSWVFVNISDVNINKKLNTSLSYETDDNSYIVVYEDHPAGTSYTPVKSIIVGSRLYFQTAEDHIGGEYNENTYTIYYMAPGIRSLSSVEVDGITKYYLDSTESSETYASSDDVLELMYEVDLSTNSYYNFSFINTSVDSWSNGESSVQGSTFHATFSGPEFRLVGTKSPDGCRFEIELFPMDRNFQFAGRKTAVIDTYSSLEIDNQTLFYTKDLMEMDYMAIVKILSKSNVKSSGHRLKVKSYSFAYNTYSKVQSEEVRNDITSIKIGAGTLSSGIVSSATTTETIVNNTYESVDNRDALVTFWMGGM